MSAQTRIKMAIALMGAGGVFAALNGRDYPILFKTIMLVLALLSVTAGLMLILFMMPRPNGFIGIIKLIPICKAQLKAKWGICKRCFGFVIGFLVSVILVVLVECKDPLVQYIRGINPWILLVLAMLCVVPTAWQGFHRRLGNRYKDVHPASIIIMGFLAGLGFFLASQAFHGLLPN